MKQVPYQIALAWSCMFAGEAISAPQPLHLCAPPADPIEDRELLAKYDSSPQDEYSRYFDDLNAYLICLQKSQADIIEQGHYFHDRYIELFDD